MLALGWCLGLVLWTVALLTTTPVRFGADVLPDVLQFPTAKTLHVCSYAFLAAYAAWLPLGRGRWLLLALLSLHAAGTEYLQTFVPGRTGKAADVLLDHVGLLLGVALTWKRWPLRRASGGRKPPDSDAKNQRAYAPRSPLR